MCHQLEINLRNRVVESINVRFLRAEAFCNLEPREELRYLPVKVPVRVRKTRTEPKAFTQSVAHKPRNNHANAHSARRHDWRYQGSYSEIYANHNSTQRHLQRKVGSIS